MEPTLSVLLPTYRDRFRLGVQLEAIVPQLRPVDELIILLDGSDALTAGIARGFPFPNVRVIEQAGPSGVCRAYNEAARHARGTWVIGASGNDEWQPGALEAWLQAAKRWPEARTMHGHITTWKMKPWLPATSFLDRRMLPAIWKDQGWQTHGAATFIRRDAWGKGYPETLGYMADHLHSMVLSFTYGCVYLRHKISRVNFLEGSESQKHGDQVSREKEKAEFMRLIMQPEYDAVRPVFTLFNIMTRWDKEEKN